MVSNSTTPGCYILSKLLALWVSLESISNICVPVFSTQYSPWWVAVLHFSPFPIYFQILSPFRMFFSVVRFCLNFKFQRMCRPFFLYVLRRKINRTLLYKAEPKFFLCLISQARYTHPFSKLGNSINPVSGQPFFLFSILYLFCFLCCIEVKTDGPRRVGYTYLTL